MAKELGFHGLPKYLENVKFGQQQKGGNRKRISPVRGNDEKKGKDKSTIIPTNI